MVPRENVCCLIQTKSRLHWIVLSVGSSLLGESPDGGVGGLSQTNPIEYFQVVTLTSLKSIIGIFQERRTQAFVKPKFITA